MEKPTDKAPPPQPDAAETTAAEQVAPPVAVAEGQFLAAAGVEMLSQLPSREALRAQLLGVLPRPAGQLVGTLAAPGAQLARVLDARKSQLS